MRESTRLTSITDMAMSLVQNMNLVGKIYFPREALPIAALLARIADFGISLILLVILATVILSEWISAKVRHAIL